MDFNSVVITTAGLALIAKVTAGETSTTFTRIATGDGSYAAGEDVKDLIALKSEKQSFTPTVIESNDVDTAHLQFVISTVNEDSSKLTSGYYFKEIGIFAEDPDDGEILYALSYAKADKWDWIPPYNGSKPWTATGDIYVKVSPDGEVTLTASEIAYATQKSVTNVINNIGGLSNLSTRTKGTLVGAINEVNAQGLNLGDISDLNTDDKSSAVDAINEIASRSPFIVTKHNSSDIELQEDTTVTLTPFSYTATTHCIVAVFCGFYITGGSEGKDLFIGDSHRRLSRDSDGRIVANCSHVQELSEGETIALTMNTENEQLTLEGSSSERYCNVHYLVFPLKEEISVTVAPKTATIETTRTVALTATTSDDSAVTWSSSNESVATVVGGVVTGVAPGIVTIRAKSGRVADIATVTVLLKLEVDITDPASTAISTSDEVQLAYTCSYSSDVTLTWTSSNPNIASVTSGGLVKGLAEGSATITLTATHTDGRSVADAVIFTVS